MAKVRIILDKHETLQEAEGDLLKALNFHASGDVHDGEQFADPAMVDVANTLEAMHKKIYQDMLSEISEALDEDYKI